MSEEPFALSTIPPQPLAAEGDFDTICETVKASARGRWFLEEYARRNRNADTAEVLAAIGRVEGVVRDGRDREAYHHVRADLLDMARTIAVTRAEVAESRAEAAPEVKSQSTPEGEPAAATSDVFAMAERIQDVAWTMRERGLDPRTCEQIETLARTILSASSLRNPNDHRARKLGEVLHYLERRIEGMLDAVATEAAARRTPPDAAAGAPAEAVTEPAADEVEIGAAEPVVEPLDQPESHDAIAVEAAPEPEEALTVTADAPDDARPSDVPAPEAIAAAEPTLDAVTLEVATAETAIIEAATIEPAAVEPITNEPAPAAATEPVDFLSEPLPPPVVSPPTPEESTPVAEEPAPAPAVTATSSEPVETAPDESAPVLPIGQVVPVVRPMPRAPSNDLLRALAAMSDAERMALFT